MQRRPRPALPLALVTGGAVRAERTVNYDDRGILFGLVRPLTPVPLETNVPSHGHASIQNSDNKNMPFLPLQKVMVGRDFAFPIPRLLVLIGHSFSHYVANFRPLERVYFLIQQPALVN